MAELCLGWDKGGWHGSAPVGCSPVCVLGSPGCREGLAMAGGVVPRLGMEGEGWRERAALQEGAGERSRDTVRAITGGGG